MLTRKDIWRRMEQGELVITPLLERNQIQPGGVDLRLGVVFIVARHSRSASLDPVQLRHSQVAIETYQDRIYVPLGRSIVLHPGETILGATLEYIVLPLDIVGLIAGRSSWGRLGLSIATALKVNPGNKSCLTLELVNLGHIPLKLYPGMRIGQMVLDNLSEADAVSSRYDFAIGPEFSRLVDDRETAYLGVPLIPTQLIIGITGLTNAGKSMIAQYVSNRLGFALKTPSMALQDELVRRHLSIANSDQKYEAKIQIRSELGDDVFAVRALQDALRDNPQGIVLDGLDHPSEIRYLRKFPSFHLIAVDGDQDWRWQRYNSSSKSNVDVLTRDEFKILDRRQRVSLGFDGVFNPHADHLDMCMKMAEYTIMSGGHSPDIINQIEMWISQQTPAFKW